MPAQDNLIMPTVERLRDALSSDNSDKLHSLRRAFCWDPEDNVFCATKAGGYDQLCLLVENFGPSCLNCINSSGDTLLQLIVHTCQDAEILDQILDLVEDTERMDCFHMRGQGSYTVAHYAAENPSTAALRWLIKLLGPRCLRDSSNDSGVTPLHLSAQHQGADSMQLYMQELGTSCFLEFDSQRRTVFHFAALNERSDAALSWLLADPDVDKDLLTFRDDYGDTPAHLAACFQGESALQLLHCQLGQQMFALTGREGGTVVHSAARNRRGHSALTWCIGQLGAQCMLTQDSLGRLPIHFAAQYQHLDCWEAAAGCLGRECLTVAADIMRRTVAHHAAMNTKCNSALGWAVRQLGPECLTQADAEGNMPIHLSARYQDEETLGLIRDALGAPAFGLGDVSQRNMAHWAAENARGRHMLDWIALHIGAEGLRVPDAFGATAESLLSH